MPDEFYKVLRFVVLAWGDIRSHRCSEIAALPELENRSDAGVFDDCHHFQSFLAAAQNGAG
jgi:hypothetical protein